MYIKNEKAIKHKIRGKMQNSKSIKQKRMEKSEEKNDMERKTEAEKRIFCLFVCFIPFINSAFILSRLK